MKLRAGKHEVKTKPATQTAKANVAPRLGQRTKSPFARYQMMQRERFGLVAPSYNIGRTRRVG